MRVYPRLGKRQLAKRSKGQKNDEKLLLGIIFSAFLAVLLMGILL